MKWFKTALFDDVERRLADGASFPDIAAFLAEHDYEVPVPSVRRQVYTERAVRADGADLLEDEETLAEEDETDLPTEESASTDDPIRKEQRRQELLSEQHRTQEMLKDAAARQTLIDAVRAEIRAMPTIRVRAPQPELETRGRPATGLLHLSDLHLGQIFESYNNGVYNLDVAEVRLRRLTEKVLSITEAIRAHRTMDSLVIAWGGDIVDGRDIHPGHDWQSVPIEVQLNRGTMLIRDLVMAPLAAAFPQLVNVCVPGNHGRIGKKSMLHRVKDNFDVVFYEWLQDRCAHMSHLTWVQAQDYYVNFHLHGHNFVLAHGDAFKSWLGLPWYGATRYLQRLSGMLHTPIDALLVGHHHQAASWVHGHSTISMNGCMVAGGEFATWLGYGGPAVQKFLLVEDRMAIATSYDLILTEREEVLTARPLDLDNLLGQVVA